MCLNLLSLGSSTIKVVQFSNSQNNTDTEFAVNYYNSVSELVYIKNVYTATNIIISVRPDLEQALSQYNINYCYLHDYKIFQPILNLYTSFGQDRFANIHASFQYLPKFQQINKLTIIDCGSYTTITGLEYKTNNWSLETNLITPGIQHELKVFNMSNLALPDLHTINIQDLSLTEKACYQGLIIRQCSFLKEYLNTTQDHQVLITGGNVQHLALELPELLDSAYCLYKPDLWVYSILD